MAEKRLALLFAAALVLLPVSFLHAEDPYSPGVRKLLVSSYALKEPADIVKALVSGAAKATVPGDRKAILSSLADYEERNGRAGDAAKHYHEAAFADPASRDDGLILDAARCSLLSGDTESADGQVRAVLLTCFDANLLLRARVYAAWIQLSAGDTAGALSLIRSYADNASFRGFAPALLFTLWWSDGDDSSRRKLLELYPASPEAAILRNEMSLAAQPFWYLMCRREDSVASFARSGSASLEPAKAVAVKQSSTAKESVKEPVKEPVTPSVAAETPVTSSAAAVSAVAQDASPASGMPSGASSGAPSGSWQQTGFFRNREYAVELKDKLEKSGFTAIIREEKRPSGTVYYSVLVPEDEKRTTGDRLKDAGFESYLVTN